MKKAFLALLLPLFMVAQAHSQKTVIGTVNYVYKVTGEGSEQMKGMMPTKMTVKYGEKGISIVMEGGMMAVMSGKTIISDETNEAFVIKASEESVYVMGEEDIRNERVKMEDMKVEEFEDTRTVLGYPCKKYVQTINAQGMEIPQTIWVTRDLVVPKYKSDAFKSVGSQGGLNYQLEGFPLMIEMKAPGMPVNIEVTVTDITFEDISGKEFEKPKGYKVKPFSEMRMF